MYFRGGFPKFHIVLSMAYRRFGGSHGGEAPVGFRHHKVFHYGAQFCDAFDDFVALRDLVRGFGRGVGRRPSGGASERSLSLRCGVGGNRVHTVRCRPWRSQ